MGFKTNIRDYLFDAHVLVMPSRTEGLPMALIEAAACGRPVVASRVGGIPEIVEHGVNGLLVEPDQVDALAAAIEEIGGNLNRFMIESGARVSLIRDSYSPENWVRIAVEEYNKALES
jgi:glycosyltransferase involved in cell wall biosynthesis